MTDLFAGEGHSLSFEHLALLLAGEGKSPALQLLRVPPGARSFLASRLLGRLSRPLLLVVPTVKEAEEAHRELSAYLPEGKAFLYPSLEVAPYEEAPPYLPAVHERMRLLARLLAGEAVAAVAAAPALLEGTVPPEELSAGVFTLRPGDEADPQDLARRLSAVGYGRLPATADPGDFSVRGGIVDLFSPAHPYPARIALDGDRVESVRWFDPETQRSATLLATLPPEVTVLPSTQLFTFSRLRERLRQAPGGGERKEPLASGVRAHGSDALLPLLYGRAGSLPDYLPKGALLLLSDASAVSAAARAAFREAEEGYALLGEEAELPAPRELYLSPERLEAFAAASPLLSFDTLPGAPLRREEPIRVELDVSGNEEIRRATATGPAEGLLLPLVLEAKEWRKRGGRFVLSSLSPSQAERMEDLLSRYNVPVRTGLSLREALEAPEGGIFVACSEVSRGFRFPEAGVAVVTEAEVFGEKTRSRKARREAAESVEEFTLRELRVNDPAVHVDHGVGIYRGLMRRTAAGTEGDFLVLEYAGGDRLFVPVDRMDRVQRYVASEESRPSLDKLGGTAWQRAKAKVRDSLLAMAQELIALQAKRELSTRPPVSPPDAAYREFEAAFPHEETADQERVIHEVLTDLSSHRPMDRLVCGDVGYGKTEVAIRAAYKVVMDGRQAAVLVPTTVLAEQHEQTFRKRLSGLPVRVESLSRFRDRKEQLSVVKEIASGAVDIVIGTHRLLQKDIAFKDLGLVVVDEEQRFGVAHKEKLKRLRASVDILTLSATPIPRTLHMAMSGLRDISVIATPPEDRLSIRTFVLPFSEETIREAVMREVKRGGQVFFVHNRVKSLPAMERYLGEILPGVRVVTAHGQMEEGELSAAMEAFTAARADLLLCTAIVESGLDLPNANTILVNHAHRFGLSQLYQLRGRVGRDRHRAYAYYLVPKDVALSKEAIQRLSVLEELTELGSGFRIASHDLEIRGGGNLVGKDQSGHVHQVGYELYTQLLSEAVAEVAGKSGEEEEEPELDLRLPAFLPDDYIPEAGERLDFYRRVSRAHTVDRTDELEMELLDRYGPPPGPARALLDLARLRARMREGGVRELKRGEATLYLTLSPRSEVDRGALAKWVTKERQTFSFVRGEVLAMRIPGEDPATVLRAARNLLNRFAPGGDNQGL
jgi:transcription-repair coupling factor (superfamily II helicase)